MPDKNFKPFFNNLVDTVEKSFGLEKGILTKECPEMKDNKFSLAAHNFKAYREYCNKINSSINKEIGPKLFQEFLKERKSKND